ncbi:EAL domain-containing protein [Methylocapsa palsarum]|uniref:PAS domain S-box-containing protein/diguanylate cyclase (GGDEF) domain-containing protein n=1 Tax=Methylocapsa palsarum TaxID=1612308 RepID=A0A1I4D5M4_9HYPH|nr:EAL domain-containing protein [Methylocapsa palsarum]SFK88303.1 PAS domain S-box-containing protein/diguanylate cyclase (GGDEF) domain-containing protein [Methylocapsa palsarum]
MRLSELPTMPKMDVELRRLMERDLRDAVAKMAFQIRYQPQINIRTRRVTGFEALLRWQHPVWGAVSPDEFIPVAEETGLIGAIGQWVLEQVCVEATTWPADVNVAVNVSPVQFDNGGLPEIVSAALRKAGLNPFRLELEVTESVPLQDNPVTLGTLQAVRDLGVLLALDDFGLGFCSLGYLLRFAFDKIKIDRSFVAEFGKAEVPSAIVRAIIALCGNLGIICTAEGVETEEQLRLLLNENCATAQGWLFGQAVTAEEISALLARTNPGDGPDPGVKRPPPLRDAFFSQIAETANDIIIVTTADLETPGPQIVYVNGAFTRLTGYTADEVIGRSPRILQGPGTSRLTLDSIHAALRSGLPVREKVLNYAKDGARYWLDMRIVPLLNAKGEITHFAAIERDVTMDKRRLDELEFLADRDTLTGIPNRRSFQNVLKTEIECAQARQGASMQGALCLALIDVDHFKKVNDERGHAVGDAVLCGLADRLAEIVRRSDTLGRIGGEEFAVCMPRISLRDAKGIAERLRHAVAAQPFDTQSGPLAVTVSIGVSAFTRGDTLKSLMERADVGMYAAKNSGRDRVRAACPDDVAH